MKRRGARPVRRAITDDALEVQVDHFTVYVEELVRSRVTRRTFNFSSHPYRALVIDSLLKDAPEISGGSVSGRAQAAALLQECLAQQGNDSPSETQPLSSDTIMGFARWMRSVPATHQRRGRNAKRVPSSARAGRVSPRFAEATIIATVSLILPLYEYALSIGAPGYSLRELESARMSLTNEFRGSTARAAARSIQHAVAGREYLGLLRGAAADLEACRERLDRELRSELHAGDSPIGFGLDGVQPYTAFSIIAAARHGVRSAELNCLVADALDAATLTLSVNAPNKAPAEIAVDAAFVEAYRLCEIWSRNARAESGRPELLQYISTGIKYSGKGVRIDTDVINRRLLPQFYDRYFRRHVRDDDTGELRPILAAYSPEDGTSPFWCNYAKLRPAAIRHFTSSENNIELGRLFARHARSSTTQQYYLHRHRLELAGNVGEALRIDASVIRMGLRNAMVFALSTDLSSAEAAGGATPDGTCLLPAQRTDTAQSPRAQLNVLPSDHAPHLCRRKQNCLECDLLRLHAWKRPEFVAKRDKALADAGRLNDAGFERDAQNRLQHAALLQAQIDRIDEVCRDISLGDWPDEKLA